MNYIKKIIKESEDVIGKAGVFHVLVFHDDWCSIYKDAGVCDCNAEISGPFLKPDVLPENN